MTRPTYIELQEVKPGDSIPEPSKEIKLMMGDEVIYDSMDPVFKNDGIAFNIFRRDDEHNFKSATSSAYMVKALDIKGIIINDLANLYEVVKSKYPDDIEVSASRMNDMISEILHVAVRRFADIDDRYEELQCNPKQS